MIPYLAVFATGATLGHLAGKYEKQRAPLTLLAILPFCILAGLRSFDVGVDIRAYVVPDFDRWSSQPLAEALASNEGEHLYCLISWLTIHVTQSVQAYLFVLQFLVIAPLAYCLIKKCPERIGLGLLIYGLLFFCYTLNIMRQSIAVSMLMLAYLALENDSIFKHLILVIVACGFHLTGVLGALLLPIEALFGTKNRWRISSENLTVVRVIGSSAFVLAVVIVITWGNYFVTELSGVKASYSYQAAHLGDGDFSGSLLMLGVVCLLLFVTSGEDRKAYQFVTALVVAGALLAQLSLVTAQLSRIGIMFLMFSPIAMSCSSASLSRGMLKSDVRLVVSLSFSLAYFLFVYVIGNPGLTMPYTFNPELITYFGR